MDIMSKTFFTTLVSVNFFICMILAGESPKSDAEAKEKLIDKRLIVLYQKFDMAIRSRDFDILEKVSIFQNKTIRKKVKNIFSKNKAIPRDFSVKKRKVHIVLKETTSSPQAIRVVFIVELQDGRYIPASVNISIANPDKEKIICSLEKLMGKPTDDSGTVVEQAIQRLGGEISVWKGLKGIKLRQNVKEYRKRLREQLTIVEYAERENIQLISGIGTKEKWKTAIEECKKLTPEKIREKVLQEAVYILNSLKEK